MRSGCIRSGPPLVTNMRCDLLQTFALVFQRHLACLLKLYMQHAAPSATLCIAHVSFPASLQSLRGQQELSRWSYCHLPLLNDALVHADVLGNPTWESEHLWRHGCSAAELGARGRAGEALRAA